MRIGSGRARTSLKTLRGDPIVIEQIMLDDVDLALEREQGKTNYEVILGHLASLQGDPPPDAEKRGGVIRELLIRNVNAHVALVPVAGKLLKQDVVVPEVRLENVGDKNAEGMEASELVGLVTQAVLFSVAKKAGGLASGLAAHLSRTGSLAEIVIDSGITKPVEELAESVDKVTEGVQKTLDGLGRFLKKKDCAPTSQSTQPPRTVSVTA